MTAAKEDVRCAVPRDPPTPRYEDHKSYNNREPRAKNKPITTAQSAVLCCAGAITLFCAMPRSRRNVWKQQENLVSRGNEIYLCSYNPSAVATDYQQAVSEGKSKKVRITTQSPFTERVASSRISPQADVLSASVWFSEVPTVSPRSLMANALPQLLVSPSDSRSVTTPSPHSSVEYFIGRGGTRIKVLVRRNRNRRHGGARTIRPLEPDEFTRAASA